MIEVSQAMIVKVDGVEYEAIAAVIERTTLEAENDHGIMDLWLHLTWGGSGQGFGGYCLDGYDWDSKTRLGSAFGCEFIKQIIQVVGCGKWEALPTSKVFILKNKGESLGMIQGIMSYDQKRVVIPSVLAANYNG